VKFAIGSFDNSFARRLGQNAANAVAHGLPYEQALKAVKAVTLYSAQILGLADQVGTLETGKITNLIVTNFDPLELTTDVKNLFIRGQLTPYRQQTKAPIRKVFKPSETLTRVRLDSETDHETFLRDARLFLLGTHVLPLSSSAPAGRFLSVWGFARPGPGTRQSH
jgi:hypothetical protein